MATDGRVRVLLVAVLGVLVVTGGVSLLALSLAPDSDPPAAGSTAAPVDDRALQRVHAAGVTGEQVSVGVVDVTGFDTDAPALSNRVAATRAFGPGASVDGRGANAHGTAAAATVARVAPAADLYLAAFASPSGYRDAVEWLVSQDVDVVVAPVTFYGRPGDGTALVSRTATYAVRNDVVFVAPAGNVARSHWRGRYQRVRNGTLLFPGGERNYLSGGGREVRLWLSWADADAGRDYTAELYRVDGDDARLVARSQPIRGDDRPNERIVARLQPGTYFVRVVGPDAATGTRLRLVSPTHALQYASPAGSVLAPATGRGVVGVGALDPRAGSVEPYSSRGPTADGRRGVDLVAPDRGVVSDAYPRFDGSSAAAAYVGGVSALVLAAAPESTPQDVEQVLEQTATDVADPGVDTTSGYGRVAPWRAVAAARYDER